jgi:putative N6-adenine-specific DNA methylase
MNTYLYQEHRQFFAQHAGGAEEAASAELHELGAQSIQQGHLGYYFKAEPEVLYRIVYMTRISTRILAPLIHFDCHSSNYLYKTAQQIDWTDFLTLTKTFSITANTADSQLRNSNYAAQILKDAIVDQFRDTFGERPNVNTRFPDLQLNLYVHKNRARISVDLGGGSLHKRGYRTEHVSAPMQENVAATILRLSNWDGKQPLFDPFCGSGTLLIEAAMKQTHLPAARFRSKFGFLRLPDFDPTLWNQIKTEANQAIIPLPEYQISGSDIDAATIQAASTHISMLPDGKNIHLQTQDFRSIESLNHHCIITNPPYGIRMETPEKTALLLKEFGDFLKQKCTGSTAFVYFGEPKLAKKLGLKPDQKWPLRTGGLEGILCRYPLY